jgi:HAD superfamily hydrolase (TIGR01450 family)
MVQTGAMTDAGPTDRDVFDRIEFVLCDLDGVVWLARQAIPGAPAAVELLRDSGRRVLFVTNNSVSVLAEQEQALAAIGIPAGGDVVTSAQAAASLVASGDHVMVCGGPGVSEAVVERGAVVIDPLADTGSAPGAVIVGLTRDVDYSMLDAASRAVRDGARFIATNDDATFPTPNGLTPGAGAIVAAVSTAAGSVPIVAGKPHAPMGDLVRARCGPRFGPATAIMVGDRWVTDGRFADVLGCPFALVRSGVTAVGTEAGGVADIDEPDLGAVVNVLLGRERRSSVEE